MVADRAEFTPESFQGNWRYRHCFVWWEPPPDADQFGLWVLSHRDSGLVEQSNGAVIRKRLADHVAGGDVIVFDCSHWLVGTTHEVAVRVYRPGTGETTAAFEVLADVVRSVDRYPVLDESDYADREYASALAGIDCMAAGEVEVPVAAPADWRGRVYDWLSDHEPTELDNVDDRGAFPAADAIRRALAALDLTGPTAA